MQDCLQSSAPVPRGGRMTDICPRKQGPVQRGGTLPRVELEIHHLDETQPFVTLNGQLCQLCASRFCAQRSVNLSLSSDKPLGFHIWGLSLAFTPYFIWHLRSCCFFFFSPSDSQLNHRFGGNRCRNRSSKNAAFSLFLFIPYKPSNT